MERRYSDAIAIAKLRMEGVDFYSALRKLAKARTVTHENIRLNVTGNINLTADDWQNFDTRKRKIADALIGRYPENRKEILKTFNIT